MSKDLKNNIALFIALLFHTCGIIGILFTPYKNWFIANTPVNLLLMALLLLWTQPKKKISFFVFLLLAFATGMGTEILGVNTSRLFGEYHYGDTLGIKYKNVPLLIGINWFVIVFCAGVIMYKIDNWILKKLGADMHVTGFMQIFSFVVDAALLATFFDWVMEPVAAKLGYWQWNGKIPFYNYTCWFFISAALLTVFHFLKFNKENQFAVHLFIIQLLFFLALRIIL